MLADQQGAARMVEGRERSGGEKRLNEMDRLADMTHFPAVVNAGATLNVLVTMMATWWVASRFAGPMSLLLWIGLVLLLNLLPVAVLRRTITKTTEFPTVRAMDFVQDQHKFSDWVYLAASANMAFWILLTWSVAGYRPQTGVLVGLLVVAFVATFSPVLVRGLKRNF